MGNILVLAGLLGCAALKPYTNAADWFSKRDEIKSILARHLATATTAHWLSILEPEDIWCARVMDYEKLMEEEGYKVLEMEITVKTSSGLNITTTRCPIRVDGEILASTIGAPSIGENNEEITKQFSLA